MQSKKRDRENQKERQRQIGRERDRDRDKYKFILLHPALRLISTNFFLLTKIQNASDIKTVERERETGTETEIKRAHRK